MKKIIYSKFGAKPSAIGSNGGFCGCGVGFGFSNTLPPAMAGGFHQEIQMILRNIWINGWIHVILVPFKVLQMPKNNYLLPDNKIL